MKLNADNTMRGNWVEYDGKYYQIDTISEEFPTLNTIDFGIGVVGWDDLKPIPTDEFNLLELGFVMDDSQLDPPDTPNGNFWVDYEKDGVVIALPFFEYQHDEICAELKYIHQVQNLFFSLKGEHLIVNLTQKNY